MATGEEDCGQRVDAEIVALQSIEVEVVVLVGSGNKIGLAVAVHEEGRVPRLIARDAVVNHAGTQHGAGAAQVRVVPVDGT